MSFGIDINGGIALRSYFLKVSGAKNIAQLLIMDPVGSSLSKLDMSRIRMFFFG